MTTPALRLTLSDARALVPTLSDGRALVPALSDARALVPTLSVAELPEPGVGGVMVVPARVPMLNVSGTPPAYFARSVVTPWAGVSGTVQPVVISLGFEVLPAEPVHYVPGALRPQDASGFTKDIIRATDALGVERDVTVWFSDLPEYGPAPQALEVAIGTDGIAALYAAGELALTATGGTGPYTWDVVTNASGCTLTSEGAYVAGPLVGIDRVRVTDALGEIGLAQLEVVAGQVGVALDGDPETEGYRYNVFGYQCQPYARVWGEGGTAPYTYELLDNQTGADLEPAKSLRVALTLLDQVDGVPGGATDLTGWTFEATLYSQRGAVLAADLAVAVTGNLLEVDLPDPSTLPLTPAVLRVAATTAGAVYALGYTTTAIEVLLVERPET